MGPRSYHVVIISTIIAPPTDAQVVVPRPVQAAPPQMDPVDQEITAILRRAGKYGMKTWRLLDQVATDQNPTSRDERRELRLAAWRRLKRLLHIGQAHWFARKNITVAKLPRLSIKRRRRSAPGSTVEKTGEGCEPELTKYLSVNLHTQPNRVLTSPVATRQTETAPAPEDLSQAARALAKLPRTRKLWRGRIGGQPSYLGMPILVDGRMGYVFGARGGKVIYSVEPDGPVGDPTSAGVLWGVVPAKDVRLITNDAATLLGQGRRGIRERTSAIKAASARLNGSRPVRPGHRARGRPRRSSSPVEAPGLTSGERLDRRGSDGHTANR